MEVKTAGDSSATSLNRARRRALARLQRTRMQSDVSGDALLMIEAVMARTGLGRSTTYAMVKAGTFPVPVKLSPRCVRWRASDVSAWLAAQ